MTSFYTLDLEFSSRFIVNSGGFMEYIKLNNGIDIPMEGFGVFQIRDFDECKQSVLDAIKTGYRLIDTAAVYANEEAVGAAIKEAIELGLCKREDLFITTKLWVQDMKNYEMAEQAILESLKRLGLDYIDLYLQHQSLGDYFSAWRAMEAAYEKGLLKAIGVSNFYPHTLINFIETVRIKPMLNQVELHPYFSQDIAIEVMNKYHVVPQAWAPLGGGRYSLFEDEMLKRIADKHQKTIAQVILRWNVQRGVVVIPKSVHLKRIQENFDIWDFKLSDDEMKQINSLDQGYVGTAVKHFTAEFTESVLSKKIHD